MMPGASSECGHYRNFQSCLKLAECDLFSSLAYAIPDLTSRTYLLPAIVELRSLKRIQPYIVA